MKSFCNRLFSLRRVTVFFFSFFLFNSIVSQNNFSSENDLKKQANTFFENEEYQQAYPLYTQLVSIYPKDPDYNYRLGVCALYSTADKEKAISYLELASLGKDVDKEVFFHLGKAYHLNYKFDKAIEAYNQFKKLASKSAFLKFDVEQQITMCNHAKSLLNNFTDIVVLDKKELSDEEFFRSYELTDIGGKLLVKPDDFKSPLDIKKKEKSIIYLSKNNDQIFYSSYGEKGNKGRDIYFINKQSDGQWSTPQALPDNINTKFDEDYPFLHPNGRSLYFASKGHNSMGGYDIFKSLYDPESGTWSNPENLDFAINTPDDDILYITDSLEKIAYFSSARLSASGMMTVFKIKVERKPIDAVVINGSFTKKSGDNSLDAKITVKNIDNNEMAGIYNTNASNGEYAIQLPNGGKFLFTVESTGVDPQSEVVIIPVQKEFRALKQAISYEDGTNKLLINNYFEESSGTGSNYLAALNFIKEKSKLEVNANAGPELLEDNSTASNDLESIKDEASATRLSNDDLVKIAYDDAEEVQKEAAELKVEADLTKSIADRKNQEAEMNSKKADELYAAAEKNQNPVEKQDQINQANELKKQSEINYKEEVVAYNLAKKLEKDAIAKKEEADLSISYAADLEAAIKSSNKEALSRLEMQKNKIESLDQQPVGTASAFDGVKKELENKQKQIEIVSEENKSIEQQIPELEAKQKQITEDAERTKNAEERKGMTAQAKAIDRDIIQLKQKAEMNTTKVGELEIEKQNLQLEAELINKLLEEIKPGSDNTPLLLVDNTVSASKVNKQESEKPEETGNADAPASDPDAQLITSSQPEVKTTGTEAKTEELKKAEEFDKKYDYINQISNAVNDTVAPPTDYSTIYADELSNADKITDDYERELAKAVINKKWELALQNDKEIISDVLDFTKKKKQKATYEKEIVALNQKIKEKQADQQKSLSKLEEVKQQEYAKLVPKSGDGYVYASPSAAGDNEKRQSLLQESKTLKKQAAIEKENADGIFDPDEKAQKLAQAAELERQSQEKEIEATETAFKANKAEFSINGFNLEELQNLSTNNLDLTSDKGKEDEIQVAELLKDEAKLFFVQAEQLKNDAAKTDDLTAKLNLLEKAKNKEMQALEKQQKAKDMYMKHHPNYTFKTTPPKPYIAKPIISDTAKLVPSTVVLAQSSDSQAQDTVSAAVNKPDDAQPAVAVEKVASTIPDKTSAPASNLSRKNLEEIKNKKEFIDFAALRAKAESSLKDAKTQYQRAEDLRKLGEDQIARSQQLIIEANTMKDEAKKKEAYLDAIALSNEAKVNLAKSDSIYELAKNRESESKSQKQESDLLLANLDDETANAMLVLVGEGPRETTTVSTVQDAPVRVIALNATNSRSEVKLAPGEQYVLSVASVYSNANPIPVNVKLPDGLIYKVQIGAFRKAIPQDIFKGISPIVGETTPQGFIRYSAGIFAQFETADAVKNEIKKLGYKDAFVVAFFNGKRIAFQELKKGNFPAADLASNVRMGEPKTVATPKVLPNQANSTNTLAGNATDLTTTNGLIYTVQVGVYSKNTKAEKLKNISSLYKEQLPNGNIRFTSGKYTALNLASIAKNSVVLNNGIQDAFVAVYYNGKRISVAEAKRIENEGVNNQQVKTIAAPATAIEKLPSSPSSLVNNQDTTGEFVAFPSDSGVVYRVQLGTYKYVPIDIATKFIKVASSGINNYKEADGSIVYTVGATREYENAYQIKLDAVDAGIKDAFIIAFYYGKKVTIDQAKEITNQNQQ